MIRRQSAGAQDPYSNVWNVTDDALLAGLAAGDPDAASGFVSRFQRRVFGLAVTITNDARMAEDVAQEAFLRAWRHGTTFDPRRGSVSTWLLAITRNLAIDAMRVRRPLAIDPDSLIAMAAPARGPGPAEAVAAGDDAGRLHDAISQLPDDQRRAIVLAGLLGFSGSEVAEHEGIPLGTAKTRIRTAMQRLRAALTSPERAE